MNNNYGGSQPPRVSNYGYSGQSQYGNQGGGGKSNAMMYAGGGMLAGAALGVGTYYMYQRMTRASCTGYSCCSGCNDACYNGVRQDCSMEMNRQYYRDDLMADSGFYPEDEKPWPLKIRIFSVAGEGYPRSAICPPSDCNALSIDDNSSDACGPSTGDEPQDLFVTLTVLENLGNPDNTASVNGAHFSATSFPGIAALPLLLLVVRSLRRAV